MTLLLHLGATLSRCVWYHGCKRHSGLMKYTSCFINRSTLSYRCCLTAVLLTKDTSYLLYSDPLTSLVALSLSSLAKLIHKRSQYNYSSTAQRSALLSDMGRVCALWPSSLQAFNNVTESTRRENIKDESLRFFGGLKACETVNTTSTSSDLPVNSVNT